MLSAEDRRTYADLAVRTSQGNLPKPPPGYKLKRTKGFPLESLDLLFGHVLNALGPELATAIPAVPAAAATGEGSGDTGGSSGSKRARSPGVDESGSNKRGLGNDGKRIGGDTGGSAGSKRARSPGVEESGSNKRGLGNDGKRTGGNTGGSGSSSGGARGGEADGDGDASGKQSPMEVVDDGRMRRKEGLESARKAFSRVLGTWEGAAAEGKRGLHQRVVARLGRMLTEADAAEEAEARSQGGRSGSKDSRLESGESTDFAVSVGWYGSKFLLWWLARVRVCSRYHTCCSSMVVCGGQ